MTAVQDFMLSVTFGCAAGIMIACWILNIKWFIEDRKEKKRKRQEEKERLEREQKETE